MKKKKIIFIQDYGTYYNDTIVIAGITDKNELFKYLKKEKVKIEFAKWTLENFNNWIELLNKNSALFCWEKNTQWTAIILNPIKDTWDYWENLMHEIHHAVHYFAKNKMMEDEIEAQAYLQEYLFRSIRRKLQGIDKI